MFSNVLYDKKDNMSQFLEIKEQGISFIILFRLHLIFYIWKFGTLFFQNVADVSWVPLWGHEAKIYPENFLQSRDQGITVSSQFIGQVQLITVAHGLRLFVMHTKTYDGSCRT